jgi:tetratricopeptide (TPR) repeat protein
MAQASGDQRILSRAFYALGDVHWHLGKLDDARTAYNQCYALARMLGDVFRETFALNRLGLLEFSQGKWAEAERLWKETLAQALAAGNRERAATALNNLGEVAKERQDYAMARDYYQQALALGYEFGAEQDIASFLINLADVFIRLGQLVEAGANLREGLKLALRRNAITWVVVGVMYAGNLAYAEGHVERALALYGLARRHPACDSEDQREMDVEQARWGLDPAIVEKGLAKGAELDFNQTVQELLN